MTPTLGNQFPIKYKENYFNKIIKPGAVFRFHVGYTNPPKIKRFIIIGITKDSKNVGFVFINSKINKQIFHTKHLQNLHLHFTANNMPFFDYDSFVDCSKIYSIKMDVFKTKFLIDTNTYLSQLFPSDLSLIVNTIRSAKTISIDEKKQYNIL